MGAKIIFPPETLFNELRSTITSDSTNKCNTKVTTTPIFGSVLGVGKHAPPTAIGAEKRPSLASSVNICIIAN